LRLLEPVLGGLVVELGCGSGLLTRHLTDAGHRVIATDASPAMLELARDTAPGAQDVRLLTLPDDPVPEADAIVSVGHVLSYLPDEAAIDAAFCAAARALRPGGILAVDICDLEWGRARASDTNAGWVGENWALVTTFSGPSPTRFVREMAVFTRNTDGSWRRDDERHVNVLIETSDLPGLLASEGVAARVGRSFGSERLPPGLYAVIGRKNRVNRDDA
jgi:SAM-dependent methyltransferase